MSIFKSVYSLKDDGDTEPFAADAASGCRVETESGAVYWLSAPDADGYRSVARMPPRDTVTASMVVQPLATAEQSREIDSSFRARLRSDVEVGMSLALEVFGSAKRILSQVVVEIEPGDVPEEVFRS